MNEIVLGSAVFTVLVMVFTLVILGARAFIWGGAQVRLTINGERRIEGAVGEKLLVALENGGVSLPTSCGGAGTCGLCRLQVSGGAGEETVLPIERATLGAAAIAAGYRLACQTVVRGDMDLVVSPELMAARTWPCAVRSTRNLSTLIKEVILRLPEGEEHVCPAGSYVMVAVPPFELPYENIDVAPEYEAEWRRMGLQNLKARCGTGLSRAYSLANRPGMGNELVLNVRLALPPAGKPDAPPGIASSYLFGLSVGDAVNVSGPYGNFFVQETGREKIFIGGGVGMAPLFAHVCDQLERLNAAHTISFWYGARARADLYYVDDMERLARTHANFSWHVALSDPAPEDEWDGPVGFIHEVVFARYLGSHPAPESCEFYLCGPPLMTEAVLGMLDKLGVPRDNIAYDDFGG